MSRLAVWTGSALLLFISACSGDRVFEEFHSLESFSWNEKDTVAFDISQVSQKSGSNLIGVRFTEEFPFSNCYIRVISKDSSGVVLENKLINVPLFNSKSGKPKGEGFGNTYTLYDTLPFKLSEHTAKVIYLQYMRQEKLPGIEALGFKIVK